MKDKVNIRVLLPATSGRYEFRMPFDITVEQGAQLVSRILATREPARYAASAEADLMYLDGTRVGELANPKETFRGLVLAGDVVEGSEFMLA